MYHILSHKDAYELSKMKSPENIKTGGRQRPAELIVSLFRAAKDHVYDRELPIIFKEKLRDAISSGGLSPHAIDSFRATCLAIMMEELTEEIASVPTEEIVDGLLLSIIAIDKGEGGDEVNFELHSRVKAIVTDELHSRARAAGYENLAEWLLQRRKAAISAELEEWTRTAQRRLH